MAKKKPMYPTVMYGLWVEDADIEDGGYVESHFDACDAVNAGESKVFAVYKLSGYVTVKTPPQVTPKPAMSKLRSKP